MKMKHAKNEKDGDVVEVDGNGVVWENFLMKQFLNLLMKD